jgi:O-antigen ligase
MELGKTLTRTSWIWELFAFGLLTLVAFLFLVPFHKSLPVLVVLLLPLLTVFVLPSVTREGVRNFATLAGSFTWWHWLWLFVLVSGQVFRARDLQNINNNPLDSAAIFRVLVEGLVALFLFARLVDERTPWLRALFRGLIGLMTVFTLISVVSTLWSVKPLWTLYKSLEYGVDLALLAAVTVTVRSVQQYEELLNWTWTLTGGLLITVWIGAVLDPHDAFVLGTEATLPIPQLTGVIPAQASNAVGEFSAILAVVSLCRILLPAENKLNRRWYQALLVFSLVTLFFAQTRTAIAGFLLATVLLLFFSRRIIMGISLASAGAVVAAFTDSAQMIWTYLLRGQSVEEAHGLSSRLEWWRLAWHVFLKRPLIGWGGFAGGRFVVLAQLNRPGTPDLHSSIIETLVDTGVFGVLFLVLTLCGAGWFLFRGVRSPMLTDSEARLAVESLAVLVVLSFRCIFSATLISHPALTYLAVLGYAEVVRRQLKYGNFRAA